MNKYKTLIKNILLLFTGTFVTKILSFLMVPFYTSILSTSDYGIADLISTTVLLVLPFFSLLMDEAIMRFTLDKNNDKKQVFTIGLLISFIGFVIILCISPILLFFSQLKKFYFFVILYYFSSWIYNISFSYVKGLNKLSLTTVAGIIHTFAFLALNIVTLAVLDLGVYGYLLSINISNLLAVIYLVFKCSLYKNIISLKRIDKKLAIEMLKYSFPMIPDYISWWVINCSDRYMLAFMTNTSEVGIYSVSYKIPTILNFLSSIFSSAWKISSVDDFGTESSLKFYNRVYKLYSSFLIIGGSILILFTKILSSILFSKQFFIAWKITPILIFAYVLSAQALFIGSIFTASKKTKGLFISSSIGAIVNIVLNFLLIPYLNGVGAAIATSIGYFVILNINIFNTKKIINMNFYIEECICSYFLLIIEIFLLIIGKYSYQIGFICFIGVCVINRKPLYELLTFFKKKINKKNKRGGK